MGGESKSCNNGTILGRSVSGDNNTYISQLIVSITSDLAGKNIECVYDNETDVTNVGMITIAVGW